MDINFEAPPFTGFAGYTNEELRSIWMHLYQQNLNLPKQIEITEQNKTYDGTMIKASKNGISKSIEILCNEVTILKDKKLFGKIYAVLQLDLIISAILKSNKYDLKINGSKIDRDSFLGQSKINKIEIETKIDLEFENFKNYIIRERNDSFENETKIEEEIIEIEKLRLSPYFNDIIKEPQTGNYFKLIINENRLKLIRKINEFWVSDDLFYVIMGTDGIGKTTTLFYFINYIHFIIMECFI